MTVRLAAMFEEHMSKIIYNWKVAKRRENMQNGKQRRSRRKQTVQNGNNDDTSDSDGASSSNHSAVYTTNVCFNGVTQTNHQNNNKTKYVPSSSSDEGPSTSFTNHKNTKHKSDSEDSYKPNSRKRKKKVEDSSSASEVTASDDEEDDDDDDDDDEDDSDNQPLSVHTNKRPTRLRPKKKTMCIADSSDSDGEVNKMRTRQCKRPRYIEEDTDSDCCNKIVKQKNGENDDDSNEECVVSVSSRGRVRRMTARARALFRK